MICVRAGDVAYLGTSTGEISRLFGLADDDLAAVPVKNLSDLYMHWYYGTDGNLEIANRVHGLVTRGKIPYFTYQRSDNIYLCAGYGARGQLLTRHGRSKLELYKNCLTSMYGDKIDLDRLSEGLSIEALPLLKELLDAPRLEFQRAYKTNNEDDVRDVRVKRKPQAANVNAAAWNSWAEGLTPNRTMPAYSTAASRNKWRWYGVDCGRALLCGSQKTARALKNRGHWVRLCENAGTPLCGIEWAQDLQTILWIFPELHNPFREPRKPRTPINPPDALNQEFIVLLGNRELDP